MFQWISEPQIQDLVPLETQFSSHFPLPRAPLRSEITR